MRGTDLSVLVLLITLGLVLLSGAFALLLTDGTPAPTAEVAEPLLIETELSSSDDPTNLAQLRPKGQAPRSELRRAAEALPEHRRAAICGRLLSEDVPLQEPQVFVWRLDEADQPIGEREEPTTLVGGFFRYRSLPPGRYAIDAVAQSHALRGPRIFSLSPGESRNGLDLLLEPCCHVQGFVINELGDVMGKATVIATAVSPTQPGSDPFRRREASTLPDGSYRLTLRPGCEYQFTAAARRHEMASTLPPMTFDHDDTMSFRLRPLHLLSGTVTQRSTDEIRLTIPDQGLKTTADEHGQFRFLGVQPSDSTVEVQAVTTNLLRLARLSISYTGETRYDAVVPLQPAASISGRVLDVEGEPIRPEQLVAEVWTGRDWRLPWTWRLIKIETVQVNADGSFQLLGLEPGALYRVRASGKDLVPLAESLRQDVLAGTKDLTLVVERGATIAGAVKTTSDAPAPDVIVHAHRGEKIVARARTKADGRFSIVGLEAGTYRVDLGWEREEMEVAPIEVVLESGKTPDDLAFQIRYGEVTGTVTSRIGVPIPGARVTIRRNVEPKRVYETTTSAVGTYRFVDVIGGRYGVEIEAPSYGAGHAGVTVPWQQLVPCDLEIVPRSGIAGEVIGTDEPVIVAVQPSEGQRREQFLSRREARFTFEKVPAGETHILAHTRDWELIGRHSLDVLPDAWHDGIRLQLVPARSIEGIVVDRMGKPRASIAVEAKLQPDGVVTRDATTDANGRFVLAPLYKGTWELNVLQCLETEPTLVEVTDRTVHGVELTTYE